MRRAIFILSLFAATTLARAASPQLHAGDATLEWVGDDAHGYRPQFRIADTILETSSLASLYVLEPAGDETTHRVDVNADKVDGDGRSLDVRATARTAGGTTFNIEDSWTVADDGKTFVVKRTIRVATVGYDRAFGSGFEIAAPASLRALADADVFVPGMWYGTEANTPASSLIHDVGQNDFLLREDRMALPLVSLRDRASGMTVTLTHQSPDGATIVADDNIARVIDARLRFASLGLRRDSERLAVAFRFPGTEGEQTSIYGYKPDRRTAERLHPIVADASQTYTFAIRVAHQRDFAHQLHDAWRGAFAQANPQPLSVDAAAVYGASIGVLAHYAYDRNGVSGIPFAVRLPDGVEKDPSLQMGFVGQQLPCASYLIDDGLRSKQPSLVAQGERIVDFWATQSLSPGGVPRTWFDLEPKPHWRDYHTFLRVASDGTSGMLRAWQIERLAGRPKPRWLAFCRSVGDWLVKTQNADGSFYREWTFDGRPASQSLTSTLHPVRLLIDLSCATGDARYRAAAVRAAEWSLAHDVDGRTYVGGTPDNPDVIDKEAGWIAFDSYLALYDVTQDRKWITAAVAAATFTETWIYGWNVPMAADANDLSIPRLKTTTGAASLIATGHSGSDLFLAYASLSYLRLAIATGDTHFADVARLLQANTAQFVDVNGSNGYAVPGLCVEAFSLAVRRGYSVGVWLPWCTSAILEPMARSREIFGKLDVDAASRLDPAEQVRRNHAFATTRGFNRP